MNATEYYLLALRKIFPNVSPRLSFASRVNHISRHVRIVGADGERVVEMRKNFVSLGDLVEAYADACSLENCNVSTQLTQGFRLFDDQSRIVENATRVEFHNKFYDWDGYPRESGDNVTFEIVDTKFFLLILGSFSVPCDDVFYGEVDSVAADAVETATGVCALLMFRADSCVSQIAGHTDDELTVLYNHMERRQVTLLEEREANKVLRLYDVRVERASREINASRRQIVVGLLGTQEPLVIVPRPASLCAYDALDDVVTQSLRVSQEKSMASFRRSLAHVDDDVVLTISRCEPAHLRWLEHDESFKSSNEWQFALLVSEVRVRAFLLFSVPAALEFLKTSSELFSQVDKLAWNQTVQMARKRERDDVCGREAQLDFLEDRRRVRERRDALVRAKSLRSFREKRVFECPEGGCLLGWKIVRYTRSTALLVRDTSLDAVEGDVSRPCDLSREAEIVANGLR